MTDRRRMYLSIVMKDSLQPAKRQRYDAAFRAEALRLASESRSTQAAARALNIDLKRLYKWQKEALTPMAVARGAELDPATAAELRPSCPGRASSCTVPPPSPPRGTSYGK